jgi:CMP-N,N'-diacetyllegionaminic acid synthase
MNTLGVILARAGSLGLANKHLLPLLGRPVIDYTFEQARRSQRLTKVVVSTDCPRIRSLARAAGLIAIERPDYLATAEASVQDAMLHALDTVEADRSFHADALVVLYGNCPVRADGVIDRAIAKLAETGCDSVRTFCPVGKWHPAWMSRVDDDGNVDAFRPGSIHRRQDLEPLYLHDGGAVVVSRASMLRGRQFPTDPHAFFGIDRRGVKTEPGEVIEVDHQRDMYWAEAVLRDRQMTMRKAS